MPVTRSTGKKGGDKPTPSATTSGTTTGTSTTGGTTGTEQTATTSTEQTGTTSVEQSAPSVDRQNVTADTAAEAAAPAPAADAADAQATAAAATAPSQEERTVCYRSKPASTRSLKARRLAKARIDLAQAKADLARATTELAAARLAAMEAEQSDDEPDDGSVLTRYHEDGRIHNWLQSSQLVAAAPESQEEPTPHSALPRLMPPPPPPPLPVPSMEEQVPKPLAARQQNKTAMPQQEPVITAASWPPNPRATPLPAEPQASITPADRTGADKRTETQNLTSAITHAIQAAQQQHAPRFAELPGFNGANQDWLTFRAAYQETSQHYSALENMSRLRKSLRGAAREAVQGLLIANANPDSVMKALEVRFGRPDSIAEAEMKRLRILPRLTESPKELCAFATRVENIVATLQTLNCVHYLYNPELIRNIVEKLTPILRRLWYEYSAAQPKDEPDLLKFSRFIRKEAELCSPFASPEDITSADPEPNLRKRPQRVHAVHEDNRFNCTLCQQNHSIADCEKFKHASTEARWDIAKKNRLCFRCLRHRSKQHSCRPRRCEVNECKYYHHRLLHSNTPPVKKEEKKEEKINSAWSPKSSFLKIIPVHVSGPAGGIDTFALLDDGSTITLIDATLAKKIGARGPDEPLRVATFDGETATYKKSRRVTITLQGKNTSKQRVHARTVNHLELTAQHIPREAVKECEHLRDISEDIQYNYAKPKILIGQDNWHLLLAEETRRGRRNQPVASLTPLGWVLHGSHTRTLGHRVNFLRHSPDDQLEELVKEYITMDNVYIDPRRPSNDGAEKALRILKEHTTRTPEGKYRTSLLWKTEDVKMPQNYENTLKRLHGIEKKIDKNPELKRRYNEQMEALVSKGYAEPAPPSSSPKKWYLPHFPVFNPMKPEKLRIVHDAAAMTGGTSLNSQLLTGPDLLQSLPGVLMRFRGHPIAVTADIGEMFMQIELREEDRDALRYLWRGDRRDDKPPEEYRMKSLIFGASSSPATAIYVKDFNAEKFQEEHPEAAEAIKKKHYVDDYLDSFKNIEEAIRITRQVRDIHRHAHFELKKWMSNSPELLAALGEPATIEAAVNLKDGSPTERVLGLIWKPREDRLTFNLDLARIPPEILNRSTPTKREALKIVMSLFDPLGLVSPVTIAAKQILQEVWRRGTSWDEPIDEDLASSWDRWLLHLKSLSQVTMPRSYPGYSPAVSLQLHVFVDASESAYAAALYWRAVTEDNRVHVSLIVAKAKVAPLKVTSIPRLELQAAVLGARMASAVKEEHEKKPDATIFWTDSRTTLTWIRTGSRTYKPYVAHRVAAIEELSTANEWRWVPTKLNVADDATRNVPEDFSQEHRWFNGPDFLQEDPENWPTDDKSPVTVPEEERVYAMVSKEEKLTEAIPDVSRFSQWSRYLRATGRVLQFLQLCRPLKEEVNYKRTRRNKNADPDWNRNRRKKPSPKKQANKKTKSSQDFKPIPAELLLHAESLIVRASQEDSFGEEIALLKSKKPLPKTSRLYPLNAELTEDGIRMQSRIGATIGVPQNMKKPLIIDGDHPATRLWITHTHKELHHAGVETTVNECRQERWVLKLRPTVKQIVKRCLLCRVRTATPPQPSTGDLPACRLAHHQRPFTYTGLDYFGPLTVTVGRTHQKRYVAIFTCLTVRAIHLELVNSLSTDSAIMALRRLVARRGCPTEIWSDNGTNFHGADKEMRQAIYNATKEEAAKKKIKWRFIPPSAPFMGGAWERMVRSVKTALASTLHERHPSEEVLQTLLAEAEHTVNSRPLTHVSVSHEDPEALTPNHFLLGGPGRAPAPGDFEDRDLNLRNSWRTSQRLADMFWSRWVKEYLPELQNRREPHSKGPSLRTGDLVLIVDGNHPRNTWVRGKICATYPGPDGVVRTADIETRGGVVRRPAKKLIVIPMEGGNPAPQNDASSAADDARREYVQDR